MNTVANKIRNAKTPLQKVVQRWANSRGVDYENGAIGALSDLAQGGCESGMVGELIYYNETLKFYRRHKSEISSLLAECISDLGVNGPSYIFGEKWDTEDPLAMDTQNQNLLAWFGFEETASRIERSDSE